jgi:hypothetical protein
MTDLPVNMASLAAGITNWTKTNWTAGLGIDELAVLLIAGVALGGLDLA